MGFFRQDLEGAYISDMAPKRRFLKDFLKFSGNKNTYITLSKMAQNLKIRVSLEQNFMELDMKKNSDPKPLTFGIWGLKSGLGQFGPKVFGKRLIKSLVENPSYHLHKQDLIFSRIIR